MVKPEVGDKGGSSTDEEVKIELCAYKGNSVSEKKELTEFIRNNFDSLRVPQSNKLIN